MYDYKNLETYGWHPDDEFIRRVEPGFVFEMRRLQWYALIQVISVDARKRWAEIELWIGEEKSRDRMPINKWAGRSWALKSEEDWILAEIWGQYYRKENN